LLPSGQAVTLWPGTPTTSLNLTVLETPEPTPSPPDAWANGLGAAVNGSFNCTSHEVDQNGTRVWLPDCGVLFAATLATLPAGVDTLYFPVNTHYPGTFLFYANATIPRQVNRCVGEGARTDAYPALRTSPTNPRAFCQAVVCADDVAGSL